MPLLFGHDETVANWVAERMEGVFVFPHAAIGMLDSKGVLRGGFVLSVHNQFTAELTLYSEDVVTNGMARGFFKWCFLQLGVHRLQIRTTRKNSSVKRAAPKMGFKFEGVARDFYGPGDDALLFYMTPQDCRWIRAYGKHVQKAEGAGAAGRQKHGQGHPHRKREDSPNRHSLQPA